MRRFRLRAWARSLAVASASLVAVSGLAPGAMAQDFDRLFIFGDSYADLTLANPLVTGQVGISAWNVYPVSLGQNLNIPNTEWKDFAVGGATASPNGKPGLPPFWNLPQQVEDFISKGNAFKSGDLITINIGGNDIRALLGNTASENAAFGYLNATINSLNAKDFAAVTTALVTQQIDRLIKANAQNFVLGSFSSSRGHRRRLCQGLFRRHADVASAVR
jgi:phospholipase/lecithinase/hemolysin